MNSIIRKWLLLFLSLVVIFSNMMAITPSVADSLQKKLNNSDNADKLIILKELVKATDSVSGKYLDYAYKLLDLARIDRDIPSQILSLKKIGNILFNWVKYKESLNLLNEALILSNNIKDTITEINCLNDIGEIYLKLQYYEKAKLYFESGYIISKYCKYSDGIIASMKNIGLIYFYINDLKNSTSFIKRSFVESFISSNNYEEAKNLNEFGLIYYNKKDYNKAIKNCSNSLNIAIKYNFIRTISDDYELLSKVYKDLGDYKKSLDYYTLYTRIQDTIYNIEKNKQVIFIQAKYEADKQAQEIRALKNDKWIKELQLQKNKNILFSVIAMFFLVMIIIIIWLDSRVKSESKRKLILKTIEIEEVQKKRIAQDLHDDLGPHLSSVLNYVDAVIHNTHDEKQMGILKRIEELMEISIDTSRTISTNVTPASLNKYGFFPALQYFCDLINNSGKLRIIMNVDGKAEKFNPTLEIIIYRVITELINNSIKHAHASVIKINLIIRDGLLTTLYSDDGIGFDFYKTIKNPEKGLGLNNIMNRITLIKGKCQFETAPGKGTKVKIDIRMDL